MTVGFIAPDAGRGAVGRGLLEMVWALQKFSIHSAVIVPGKGPLHRTLRQWGMPVVWLPVPWWSDRYNTLAGKMGRSVATLTLLGPFVAALRMLRCHVVYTHTVNVAIGAIAARLCGLPHIWHLHEFGYEDHRLYFDLGFERTAAWVDRLSTVCIAVSQAVARKYSQFVSPTKLRTIYQAVTVTPDPAGEARARRQRAEAGRSLRLIAVGEVKETKGQLDAVLALGELIAEGIDAELLLVGDEDPDYGRHLRRVAGQLGILDRVRFTGWVDNPFPLVRSADVAVVCSRFEGFGRVTIEAMLAGRPVLGARAGATPELVRDGFNGFLYTPGDAKQLAEYARLLHENRELARRLGETGLRWASEQFTKERYGREIASVLNEVLHSSVRGRRGP